MLGKYVLYYGRDEAPPRKIKLQAGPLSMDYQNGDLRYIRLGEKEVLRRVYCAIRDHNWDTAPNVISNENFAIKDESFSVSYDVTNQLGEINFKWHATITGETSGSIVFSFKGKALRNYEHNRTGYCLLHPISECSGKKVWVEQKDGIVREGMFPVLLDSEEIPPFTDMRSMCYELVPGIEVCFQFSGDLFELEDQRNWTDGSYKTYSTPQRNPIPMVAQKGQIVQQSLSIALKSIEVTSFDSKTIDEEKGIQIVVDESIYKPLPSIGLGVASHGHKLLVEDITALKLLKPAHIRMDLFVKKPGCVQELQRAMDEAESIGTPLEIALFIDGTANEIKKFKNIINDLEPKVCRWMVFGPGMISTSETIIDSVKPIIKQFDNKSIIGGGSNAFFWELNHFRAPFQKLDFVCYPITPQVHVNDNDSLVEALQAQSLTVATAQDFVGELPIVVSPITLKMRFNPSAIGPESDLNPGDLPSSVDVRQMSLFCAGWTLGSIHNLTMSGASSLTYYETTGWRGVKETKNGSEIPQKFITIPGMVFPVYHVLTAINEFDDGVVLSTTSSNTLRVVALCLRKNGFRRLLIANLTHTIQDIDIKGFGQPSSLWILDENSAVNSLMNPGIIHDIAEKPKVHSDGIDKISLLPYAIAFIDSMLG